MGKLVYGSRAKFQKMSDEELTKAAEDLLVMQARRGRLLMMGDDKTIVDPVTDIERMKKILTTYMVVVADE